METGPAGWVAPWRLLAAAAAGAGAGGGDVDAAAAAVDGGVDVAAVGRRLASTSAGNPGTGNLAPWAGWFWAKQLAATAPGQAS